MLHPGLDVKLNVFILACASNDTARLVLPTPLVPLVPSAPSVPSAAPAVLYSGPLELRLTGVDEKTAAMIMAIVCDESGLPANELYFKSIKALD